jgi:hydroxyacylglutathione hydrolase
MLMIKITEMTVSPFMQNARILHCPISNHSVLIDPGGDAPVIIDKIKSSGSDLKEIWLTHSHLDHCGAVKEILEVFPVKLLGHKEEAFMRANVESLAAMYGIPAGILSNCPEPDTYISGGEKLKVGEIIFDVLFTPGHSPGHVSFYSATEEIVVSGDVLFADSIGRTDLPGGDHDLLIKSVKEKLFTLPPATKVLSGHGGNTTIGKELKENPFFNAVY